MPRKRTTRRKQKQKRTRKQRGGNIIGLLDNADGVPIQNAPPIDFIVKFGPSSTKTASDFGNSIEITESKPEPRVFWKVLSPDTMYTVICWDPDAKEKSWLHWLYVNCKNGSLEHGIEVVDWSPPTPPKGSGLHRYIFGLFQQKGQLTLDAPPHAGFHVANFAAQHNLTPIAYKGMRITA
jgi:phosphatidylethanolamine-binding protein (PEBP) family uncharacterized protein